MIQGAIESLKPKEGEEQTGIQNLIYVCASWLTKEGILSGKTVTLDMQDNGTYTTQSWGQQIDEGVFVEHVNDSHLILYGCQNVGEDQMDQRVRVLVDQTKIPQTDEDYQVFRDATTKAITDVQNKFNQANGQELETYNVE